MPEKGQSERKAELKPKAYRLRIAGLSYRRIGEQLGIDHTIAFDYVKETLKQLREETLELADQYREMELSRLDEAQSAIYNKVLKGDEKAIEKLLKIQERRSKYLGLDVPVSTITTIKMPEPILFVLEPDETSKSN